MTAWLEAYGTQLDWSRDCPFCRGTSFLSSGVEQAVQPFREVSETRCPCWLLYQSAQRLWECRFPRGYTRYHWDSLYPIDGSYQFTAEVRDWWAARHPDSYAWVFQGGEQGSDVAALDFWVENTENVVYRKGLSLVIWGDKGVGKTALATVLAKEAVKRRGLDAAGWVEAFQPRFVACDEVHDLVLARSSATRASFSDLLSADVLVLDDLRLTYQGYSQTEYLERMHFLLQSRAANDLPTIITANKLGDAADFTPNGVTQFLGIGSHDVPEKFGKYRFIRLVNQPLRPEPEWTI